MEFEPKTKQKTIYGLLSDIHLSLKQNKKQIQICNIISKCSFENNETFANVCRQYLDPKQNRKKKKYFQYLSKIKLKIISPYDHRMHESIHDPSQHP